MPDEVRDVAEALAGFGRGELRERYARLPQEFHEATWAKDEEYLFDLLVRMNRLRKFYQRAAQEGRAVMFYTDDPLDYLYKANSPPAVETAG
jgi:hypothetical protein